MSEIAAAIQGFKLLWDKIKATKELSNSTDLLIAVNDVQQKLTDANTAALASLEKQGELANQVRELQRQLTITEDWKSEIQRYELFVFPTKALAYRLKAEMVNGVPMHYICTACADKKKKTTLQPKHRYLHSPECKSMIMIEEPPPTNRRSKPVSWKVM